MSLRAKWWMGALFLTAELLLVGTHPDYARSVYRAVYNALWQIAPKPAGFVR